MSPEAKLYLADRLIKAGFKRLEGPSAMWPAPQFFDVDELAASSFPWRWTWSIPPGPHPCHRAVGGPPDRVDRPVLTGQIATSEAYAMKNMRRTHQQLF